MSTSLILCSNADPTSVFNKLLGYITGLRGLPEPETPPGVDGGGDVGRVDNSEPWPLPPPLPLLPLSVDPFDQTD